ncbi:unnamed protein product [Allacma fusca]|uniref:Uncharacterized protein n=1 Tax=Allacma fusca TaxID=39272 RepID=A0A8J2L5H1_9HEXA|nr:unnamed protein product [Allacma fusca]
MGDQPVVQIPPFQPRGLSKGQQSSGVSQSGLSCDSGAEETFGSRVSIRTCFRGFPEPKKEFAHVDMFLMALVPD